MLELIYFISVLVGLVAVFFTDYEEKRLKLLNDKIRIPEFKLLVMGIIGAFIPILNTYMSINFIYKFLNKK